MKPIFVFWKFFPYFHHISLVCFNENNWVIRKLQVAYIKASMV